VVHASVRLAPVPESAARARNFIDATLRIWDCAGVVDDARVVVTELVSNVVRHAGTEVAIDLDLVGDCLHMAVVDHANGEVALKASDAGAEVGRGLRLVDTLSDRWGVQQQPGEKCVWAEWSVGGRSASRV